MEGSQPLGTTSLFSESVSSVLVVFNFIFYYYFYILFMIALGLLCYWRAFSSCHQQRLLSSYSVGASHCSGFSSCRERALGVWISGVVAQGLSYSMVCVIFPDQRWNLCHLFWQVDSLPLRHQGSPVCLFLIKCLICE